VELFDLSQASNIGWKHIARVLFFRKLWGAYPGYDGVNERGFLAPWKWHVESK
jgi:hypothetical protein